MKSIWHSLGNKTSDGIRIYSSCSGTGHSVNLPQTLVIYRAGGKFFHLDVPWYVITLFYLSFKLYYLHSFIMFNISFTSPEFKSYYSWDHTGYLCSNYNSEENIQKTVLHESSSTLILVARSSEVLGIVLKNTEKQINIQSYACTYIILICN